MLDLKRVVTRLGRHRDWYSRRAIGVVAGSLVRVYRPLLARCAFIAVTGSCGKTTAKELIAGVLGSKFPGNKSREGFNQHYHTATSLLRASPRDRFNVQEVGIGKFGAGVIDAALRLIRPTIGVVTAIGSDHISTFGSREAIAREKRKLVEWLPATGTAVLNADDPLVLAMREHCKGRVLTYGMGAGADVRAEDVDATWPSRLTFRVRHDDQVASVETQLCGAHWMPSALAALSVGVAMGMTLAEAAAGIRAVPPFRGRMFPVVRDDGVAFVFDDAKTPNWTIPAAFAFVREARASRRFIVVGSISDYTGSSEKVYVTAAKEALRSADHVVFVGSKASKSLPARRTAPSIPFHAFYSIDAACDHLAGELQAGDLVLLKGTPADRLQRIFDTPAGGAGVAGRAPVATAAAAASESPQTTGERWVQAVVAFGNPDEKYRGSPHNVGWEVVELLARFFDARWRAEPEAHVASIDLAGGTLHLIKPRTAVNRTGPALLALGRRLGFGAAGCVLVHDDLSLDPGVLRARENGNDGGHNGVRSVLGAYADIAIRRLKIGVGRPGPGTSVRDHVLTPMPADRIAVVQAAYPEAARRVLTLLSLPRAAHAELMELRRRFDVERGNGSDANVRQTRAAD